MQGVPADYVHNVQRLAVDLLCAIKHFSLLNFAIIKYASWPLKRASFKFNFVFAWNAEQNQQIFMDFKTVGSYLKFLLFLIKLSFSDTTVIEGGRERKHSWDLSLLFWETRYSY